MRTALFASLSFAALGLCDVGLRLKSLGVAPGLRAVANDPGKDFFHIFLLPALVYLLIRVPITSTGLIRGPLRTLAMRAILGLLVVTAAIQSMTESKDAFFFRNASPEDFSDTKISDDYRKARAGLKSLLQNNLPMEGIATAKAVDIAESHGISLSIPSGTNIFKGLTGEDARSYAFAKARTLASSEGTDLPAYLSKANCRRHVATLLHFIGVLVAAWLFFAVCFSSLPKTQSSSKERDILLVMVALCSIWLPLRYYSEWYHQFFANNVVYGPLIYGAYLSIAATVIVFYRSSRTIFASIAPAALTLISAIFTLVVKNKGEVFSPIANLYRDASWEGVLVIHVITIVAMIAVGRELHIRIEEGFDLAEVQKNAQSGRDGRIAPATPPTPPGTGRFQ